MEVTMGIELIPILSGFSALIVLIQARQNHGWQIVSVAILFCLAIGWGIAPLSGFLTIASLLWAFGLVLPMQGFLQVERQVSQEKFDAAAKLMTMIRYLHPWDGWWHYPELLRALGLVQVGQATLAQRIFQQYATDKSPIERLAIIMLHRLNGQWSSFVTWLQQQPVNAPAHQDPNVQLMYLRSLGETGKLNELVGALQKAELLLQKAGNPTFINTARLYAFAFCGQRESLAWLLQQQMRHLPNDTQTFWQATAQWNSGDRRQAKRQLQALQQSGTADLQSAINARLQRTARKSTEKLTPAALNYLIRLQGQMMQESQPAAPNVRPNLKQIPVTMRLIVINVAITAFFTLAIAGLAIGANVIDFTNEHGDSNSIMTGIAEPIINLYELGILYPDRVYRGEAWRLVTAAFLHAGWFHLFSNMIGLYVLGGIVEPMLGKMRYAIAYLATGIGSMACVTVLNNLGLINEPSVVGASGAIMGLLGVIGGIFCIRWLKFKEAVAAQRLKMFAIITVFQIISDQMVANVSRAGHLSGLLLGIAIGLGFSGVAQFSRSGD
jgi:membrane associated rhomboid family serine protease